MSTNVQSIVSTWVCWKWDLINKIGQNKSLKSSYWFLVVVPIIAKLFRNFPAELPLKISDAIVTLHLELPFSWVLLFFCALCVSLGNLIYTFGCPELIKEFDGFVAFQASSRDTSILKSALSIFARTSARDKDTSALVDLVARDVLKEVEPNLVLNAKHQLSLHGPAGSDSFYFVRDALNLSRTALRSVASIAYILGFAFILWISIQNVWFVFCYLFGKSV